MSVVTSEIK